MSEAADDGGSVLAGYISTQLAKQDARKASLEQRGLAVITTSGAALTDLKVLADAKRKNDVKAKLLFRAISFEVAAVVLVAAAVGVVVNGWALLGASVAALAVGVVAYVRAYGWSKPNDGTLGVLLRAAQANWGGD